MCHGNVNVHLKIASPEAPKLAGKTGPCSRWIQCSFHCIACAMHCMRALMYKNHINLHLSVKLHMEAQFHPLVPREYAN